MIVNILNTDTQTHLTLIKLLAVKSLTHFSLWTKAPAILKRFQNEMKCCLLTHLTVVYFLCLLLWRNGVQVALTLSSVHSNFNTTCPGPPSTTWRRGTRRSPSWINYWARRLPYLHTQDPTSGASLIRGLLNWTE